MDKHGVHGVVRASFVGEYTYDTYPRFFLNSMSLYGNEWRMRKMFNRVFVFFHSIIFSPFIDPHCRSKTKIPYQIISGSGLECHQMALAIFTMYEGERYTVLSYSCNFSRFSNGDVQSEGSLESSTEIR